MLDLLLVHYDEMPILRPEMEQYFGRCGTVDMSGDGAGMFVFAFIPGGTYNLIRERALDPAVDAATRILYRAIVLRDLPQEMANPDGTIRYQSLMESGFYYRNRRSPLPDEALGFAPFPGWFDDAVDWVDDNIVDRASDAADHLGDWFVRGARGFGRGAMLFLGAADRFLYGSIDLDFDLRIANRDSAFYLGNVQEPIAEMSPGWSAQYDDDDDLELKGVRVEMNMWAVRPLTGIVPMKFSSNTSSNGYTTLTVSRNNGNIIGGSAGAFQNQGLCVFWKNDAAEITQSLFPEKLCDWRVNPNLRFNRENDGEMHPIETWSSAGHVLNQITEARNFMVHSGHSPRRATVLRGHNAAVVTPADDDTGERALFAPCLGFTSLSYELYQSAGARFAPIVGFADCLDEAVDVINGPAGGEAGPDTGNACEVDRLLAQYIGAFWYMGNFSRADILMPDISGPIDSRSVMVHEYGHYSVCSILDGSQNSATGTKLTSLYLDYITNSRGTTAHVFESLADMIAAQVTGSVNYFPPMDDRDAYIESNDMSFCNQKGGCLEGNYDGTTLPPGFTELSDFDLRVGRLTTLYVDAFDGWRDNQNQYFRHDDAGGYLISSPSFISQEPDPIIEIVELPVDNFLVKFIEGWGDRKEGQGLDAEEAALESIGAVMAEEYSWCEICDVFGLHEPGVDATNIRELWEECRDGEIARYLPGGPPDPDLRMGHTLTRSCYVCPEHQRSNADGLCEACPSGQGVVGNECVPCPPGEVVNSDGVCGPCGFNEKAVASQICVPCPLTQGPNAEGTECVDCPTDAVVNWSNLTMCGDTQDGTQDIVIEFLPPWPDDVCPDRYWVQVNEIEDMAVGPATNGAYLRVETELEGAECTESERGILTIINGVPQVDGGSPDAFYCEYPDFQFLTIEDILSGATSRRFGVFFEGEESLPNGKVQIANDYTESLCVVR